MKINAIKVANLTNGAHFTYHKNTLARIKAHATIPTKCAKLVSTYEANFAVEDEVLKVSQKSFLSDEINAKDNLRGKLYQSYRMAVKAMLNYPVEAIAEAAKILWQHMKDYNIDTSAQLDRETGMLQNLITDLKGKWAEHVETLHLTEVVEKLEEANEEVNTLIEQRENEYVNRKAGATREARAKVDAAYKDLVQVINALVILEGEADYAELIKLQNQSIARFKREALNETTGSNKPDEEGEGSMPEEVKPEITEVYSKVEDPHDATGITRGKETIMKWVGGFELVNEMGDGPGKIIVKDNFSGIEEEVPAEDILSRSNTGCEFIMIRDFAEGDYKIRIETYLDGSLLKLEYWKIIKLV